MQQATAAPVRERLVRLVDRAVRAPSPYNTQPWRFRLCGDAVELYADRSRALPATDPDGRELLLACGAALAHLRIAASAASTGADVVVLPDPGRPDLLARVRLDGPVQPDWVTLALAGAIPRRHTNRLLFDGRPVPGDLVTELAELARADGAALFRVPATPLADLIARGAHRRAADPAMRQEAAAWTHAGHDAGRDGIAGAAIGTAPRQVTRELPHADRAAAADLARWETAATLLVLATDTDAVAERLAAGQALARVLLRATVDGVASSFFGAPLAVPELRRAVRERAGLLGQPQLLLRLGYAPAAPLSPRRPVRHVLTG
ncbi:MAG: Acg family FMN-binding oxidoreductase [Mycobacterium leprae]